MEAAAGRAAGKAQSDLRLATSNLRPEGRDMGGAGEAQSDLRLVTSNYLPEGRVGEGHGR